MDQRLFHNVTAACTRGTFWILVCFYVLSVSPAFAQGDEGASSMDLTDMSLETLVNIQVVTASREEQALFKTASAVYVITSEDIRRSSATTIPDLLRTVPGVNVGQINANSWAVTVRGFNQRFSSKLLVLKDGMTIYTPTFSGVYWDFRDTLLEDIERIEIIRGPGGALWGANAVNGIINIITKDAADTQGGLVVASGGTESGSVAGRWGGAMGDDLSYRIWAEGELTDASVHDDGSRGQDEWESLKGGLRVDIRPTEDDRVTVIADLFTGHVGQDTWIPSPYAPGSLYLDEYENPYLGGNVLLRWEHGFSNDVDLAMQVFFDAVELNRRFKPGLYGPEQKAREATYTLDFDSQLSFSLGSRHDMIVGFGYRSIWDSFNGEPYWVYTASPSHLQRSIFSAFLQDTIALWEDQLFFILGCKVEHNDYTGFEVQPSARLLWTPNDRHTVWAAVSRAVRTPSRVERDALYLRQPLMGAADMGLSPAAATIASMGGLRSLMALGDAGGGFGAGGTASIPIVPELQGSDDFVSEELIALELGYRMQPVDEFSLDVTGFVNFYEKLLTMELNNLVLGQGYALLTAETTNNRRGTGYGVEVSAKWDAKDWWRLEAAYSFLEVDSWANSVGRNLLPSMETEQSPQHSASLQSSMDLPYDVEFDLVGRYTSELDGLDIGDILEMDARLAWSPYEDLEIALIGRNLLHDHHGEYKDRLVYLSDSQIERSVLAKVTWRF